MSIDGKNSYIQRFFTVTICDRLKILVCTANKGLCCTGGKMFYSAWCIYNDACKTVVTSLGRLGCFLDSDFPWLLLLLTMLVESLQSARSFSDLKCGEHITLRSRPFFAFGEENKPCIWNLSKQNLHIAWTQFVVAGNFYFPPLITCYMNKWIPFST